MLIPRRVSQLFLEQKVGEPGGGWSLQSASGSADTLDKRSVAVITMKRRRWRLMNILQSLEQTDERGGMDKGTN